MRGPGSTPARAQAALAERMEEDTCGVARLHRSSCQMGPPQLHLHTTLSACAPVRPCAVSGTRPSHRRRGCKAAPSPGLLRVRRPPTAPALALTPRVRAHVLQWGPMSPWGTFSLQPLEQNTAASQSSPGQCLQTSRRKLFLGVFFINFKNSSWLCQPQPNLAAALSHLHTGHHLRPSGSDGHWRSPASPQSPTPYPHAPLCRSPN